MRPTIVTYLNELFEVSFFNRIVPTTYSIYCIVFVLVSILLIRRLNHLDKQIRTNILFVILSALSALAGAKLAFVIPHFRSYIYAPSHIFKSGSISWGAYVGLFIFIIVYTKARRFQTLRYLDIVSTCIPVGIFIGRWGCFLNGCDFGTESSLPWSVQYPFNSIPFGVHYENGVIDHTALLSAPVHPNQLYLSINGLFLFIMINRIWFKCRETPGLTFSSYVLLYGITRLVLEAFRYYPAKSYLWFLNPSQWLAVAFAIGGGLMMLKFRFRLISEQYC